MPFNTGYQFFPQGGNSAPLGPLGPQRDPRAPMPPQAQPAGPRPLPMPIGPGSPAGQDPRLTGLDRAREVANPQAAFLREGGQANEQAAFNRPEGANNMPGQRPAAGPQGFGRAFVPGGGEDNQARQQAMQFINRLMQERPDMIAELIRRRMGQGGGQGYGGDMMAQPVPQPIPQPGMPYGNDMVARQVPSPGLPYSPDMVAQPAPQPMPPQFDLSNLLSPLGLGGGFNRAQ